MSYIRAAKDRIQACLPEIKKSLEFSARGNPFGAESDDTRRLARLQRMFSLGDRAARVLDQSIQNDVASTQKSGLGSLQTPAGSPEAQIDNPDFVAAAFLHKGMERARAVGNIVWSSSGRAEGTGVLIGAGLFLTNQHVIKTAAQADLMTVLFDAELDELGHRRRETAFRLDKPVYVSSPEDRLDYAIVAIGSKVRGPKDITDFGAIPLSDRADKHMIGNTANIVQHPGSRLKEVVLRNNQIVSRSLDGTSMHYKTDTEQGSSGSPVFNDEWDMIALHHYEGMRLQHIDPTIDQDMKVNSGIRISAIVADLRQRMPHLPEHTQARMVQALGLAGQAESFSNGEGQGSPIAPASTNTVPVHALSEGRISIQLGGASVVVETFAGGPAQNSAQQHMPLIPPGNPFAPGEDSLPQADPQPDDLTRIKGIGPKTAQRLNDEGVRSFAQIAGWSDSDLSRIGPLVGTARRATLQDWVAQAGALAGLTS